jgi:hypothetical protein
MVKSTMSMKNRNILLLGMLFVVLYGILSYFSIHQIEHNKEVLLFWYFQTLIVYIIGVVSLLFTLLQFRRLEFKFVYLLISLLAFLTFMVLKVYFPIIALFVYSIMVS